MKKAKTRVDALNLMGSKITFPKDKKGKGVLEFFILTLFLQSQLHQSLN